MSASITVVSHRLLVDIEVSAAVSRAFETCGGKAETYAKALCHVNTGRLRNSITHHQEDESTEVIGTNVEYAPHVEFGHRQQPGRYVPALGKRLVAEHVKGYPFLGPALEDHITEYKQIFENELNKL